MFRHLLYQLTTNNRPFLPTNDARYVAGIDLITHFTNSLQLAFTWLIFDCTELYEWQNSQNFLSYLKCFKIFRVTDKFKKEFNDF